MRGFRLWRMRRAYQRIARLEPKVATLDVADLRREFVSESAGMVDRSLRSHGYSRQRRRAFKRGMVAPK